MNTLSISGLALILFASCSTPYVDTIRSFENEEDDSSFSTGYSYSSSDDDNSSYSSESSDDSSMDRYGYGDDSSDDSSMDRFRYGDDSSDDVIMEPYYIPDVTCDSSDNIFKLVFAQKQLQILSTHFEPHWYNDDTSKLNSIHGTDALNNMSFWFGRDGDGSDGHFESTQSYDASRYPYHMFLGVNYHTRPNPSKNYSDDYYGIMGTWDIQVTDNWIIGSFIMTGLTQQENCWDAGPPIDISDCAMVPDALAGCFTVSRN